MANPERTKAGTWEATLYYREDGKYRKEQKTFDTKKAADAWLDENRTKVRKREYAPPAKYLVKDVCTMWLEKKQGEVKIQTYLDYKHDIYTYIVPSFGERRITDVEFQEIEKAGRRWAENWTGKELTDDSEKPSEPLQPQTVNGIFRTFGQIYKWARRFGIHHNPLLLVDRQKANKSLEAVEAEAVETFAEASENGSDGHLRVIGPHEVYSAEEINQLIAASRPGLERALHMTAVMTGLRHGELDGLQWPRVEFEKCRIFVSRSLTQPGGPALLECPKSKSAYRYLPLSPTLMKELKKWKLQCPPNEMDLVFVDGLGRPLNRKTNNVRLQNAAKRAKIRPLTMHNLRHTFASQHLMAGTSVLEVSKLMGHKDPGIILRVDAQFTEKDHSKSAAALEAAIFPTGVVGE